MSWHLCLGSVSSLSNIFIMSQYRLVSTKSEMSRLVSCLDTSLLANVDISVSEKKRLDSITAGQNRGKKQKFDRMSGKS